MRPLEERVFWVTGAGQGIGRGISLAIAEAGGRVIVSDIDGARAAETAAEISGGGGEALATATDVTDPEAVDAAADIALEIFGRFDGLVANAGVVVMAPALDLEPKALAHEYAVNVQGLFSCCQAAARRMIARGTGGAIVNVASNAGKVGYPNMAGYNASKAAVVNLTRSLSREWAEHRINVNAVCPGAVDTPMLADVAQWFAKRSGDDVAEVHRGMVPDQLGHHIRPIDVGRVVAFLLSDAALVIRGQAINVDGGDTPY